MIYTAKGDRGSSSRKARISLRLKRKTLQLHLRGTAGKYTDSMHEVVWRAPEARADDAQPMSSDV